MTLARCGGMHGAGCKNNRFARVFAQVTRLRVAEESNVPPVGTVAEAKLTDHPRIRVVWGHPVALEGSL